MSKSDNAERRDDQLREQVEKDAELLRRAYRATMGSFYITLGIIGVFLLIAVSLARAGIYGLDSATEMLYSSLTIGLIPAIMAGIVATGYFAKRGDRAARRLAAHSGVEVVGPFVDLLGLADEGIRPGVIGVLTRILPRMRASDSDRLNERQWASLLKTLDMRHARMQGDFMVAILKAVEQIGGPQALPYVERLAHTDPIRRYYQVRVKEAAQDCLPYLQERTRREQQSNKLLRVAAIADDGLLRPADGQSSSDPERLLRAPGSEQS
jgi:hypothetical protein